jgi:putative transposase
MAYDPNEHQRRSIRLAGYDYGQAGAYFVTICTEGHWRLFGRVAGDAMEWNDAGLAVERCWQEIPAHFPQVALDEFVVMPNHVHGILVIADATGHRFVGANNHSPHLVRANDYSPLPRPPDHASRPRGTSKTIGSVIRGFKIGVGRWMRDDAGRRDIWQRNYFEHIIRNDVALNRIRQYIRDNPARWACDRYNPQALNPKVEEPWEE